MKNSDKKNCLKSLLNRGSKKYSLLWLALVFTTVAFAQEPYVFMQGSVHSFAVDNHPGNTFAWSMAYDQADIMEINPADYDLMVGGDTPATTVRFNTAYPDLVYLVVKETSPNGCSTKRALQMMIEQNNMYLEFASAETQDCFNMGEYYAPLKVGLNFKDKAAGVAIPEKRFPLQVSYEIKNITDGTAAVVGNGGQPLTLEYSNINDYFLLVTEAVGELTRTIEYELNITSVTDKYQTVINNNEGDIRLQIRIINHLPQSGSMDMALAYQITPIQYLGTN